MIWEPEIGFTKDSGNVQRGHRPAYRNSNLDLILKLEDAWGGPLPGKAREIQEGPLRCEIAGFPTPRIIHAFGITQNIELVFSDGWSLYPESRMCGLYVRDIGLIPLPALPAGMLIARNNGGRILTHYDEPEDIVSYKIYALDTVEGVAESFWGDIVPDYPAAPQGFVKAYGIEYSTRFDVLEIKVYFLSTDLLSPKAEELKGYTPPSKVHHHDRDHRRT